LLFYIRLISLILEETPEEEFVGIVRKFIKENPSWIIDGNYAKALGSLTQTSSTNIVWLDPPLWLYFPRIVWRTFLQLFEFRKPCSLGCKQSLKDIFTPGEKSILWYCWTHHTTLRKRWEDQMLKDEDKKWIRIDGWGSRLEAFQVEFGELIKYQ